MTGRQPINASSVDFCNRSRGDPEWSVTHRPGDGQCRPFGQIRRLGRVSRHDARRSTGIGSPMAATKSKRGKPAAPQIRFRNLGPRQKIIPHLLELFLAATLEEQALLGQSFWVQRLRRGRGGARMRTRYARMPAIRRGGERYASSFNSPTKVIRPAQLICRPSLGGGSFPPRGALNTTPCGGIF